MYARSAAFYDAIYAAIGMVDFELGERFDVMVCLFGSIGYVVSTDRLQAAVQNMQQHLLPGGLLVIEPWLRPEDYNVGVVHAAFVDQPDLKVVRMNVSDRRAPNISVLNFHYLVAKPDGVQYFSERHELGLFSHAEYLAALAASGMEVIYEAQGLIGRGIYIGRNLRL